ncbi:TrkH family potassium uptake protein [Streptomyces sp. NPDC048639]|uniref:TrkH family potassium uptake protein n=1 Tax=Streptomyces sp. NPDC048639 TaxID=3365581 RepID=UPI0037164579
MATVTPRTRWSRPVTHPAKVVVLSFAAAIVLGTGLLALPVAARSGRATDPLTALFTATGAVTGGLSIVGTGSWFGPFGEWVVLALIQVGGLGIMTLASVLGLLVSGRLRMPLQLTAQEETGSSAAGHLRSVLLGVAATTFVIELLTGAVLFLRFRLGYGQQAGEALFYGCFHAVSAFNNAGFGLRDDNLVGYANDPWILVPVAVACILGGLGFPVLLELLRRARAHHRGVLARRWSLHTRLTLITYGILLAAGTVYICLLEWGNPATFGPMSWGDKLLNGFFLSTSARTAGFNSVDIGAMEPATLLGISVLMFIGAGSAGTAGGIKVTTFALLGAAIVAEVRGDSQVNVLGRRVPASAVRQALTVALLGLGLILAGMLVLLTVTEASVEAVLVETVSAFGTVGFTTGITGSLPAVCQLVVIALMFVGRLGPITLASALALRERGRRYELPEERPVIG